MNTSSTPTETIDVISTLNEIIHSVEDEEDTSINKSYVLSQIIVLLEFSRKANHLKSDLENLTNACCFLWDITVNPTIAVFLKDNFAIPVLMKLIQTSSNDRILELCGGTIGNMLTVCEICSVVTENKEYMDIIITSLNQQDPRVLHEITRMILSAFSHDKSRKIWIDYLTHSTPTSSPSTAPPTPFTPSPLSRLIYIFASTLDEELCDKTIKILHHILTSDESLPERILEGYDFISIISEVLADKLTKSYRKKRLNHCPELISSIVEVIEYLSTLRYSCPKLLNNSLTTTLKSIIIGSEDQLFISACITLANIEMESTETTGLVDRKLVHHLISHISFADQEETSAIYAVLCELSNQLKRSPSKDIIIVISEEIDKILQKMNNLDHCEGYMMEFLRNFFEILSNLKMGNEQGVIIMEEEEEVRDAYNSINLFLKNDN